MRKNKKNFKKNWNFLRSGVILTALCGSILPGLRAEEHDQTKGLAELRAENACLTVKDLAVNGNDLLALGYQGKAIGETLNALLEGVLDETLPNERQALLDRAKQRVANDGISSE